jgi:hypothetical protein
MASKKLVTMTEAEIIRMIALLGEPPTLSTEDPEVFKRVFVELARCFKVRNFAMLHLVWEYTCGLWVGRRYDLHSTVAVERWFRRHTESRAEAARVNKANYEAQLKAKIERYSRTPADVAEMAALEEKIANSVKDLDEILARKPTELDHNEAIQRSAAVLEKFDFLGNSGSKRRNDAYVLLERYSADLQIADEVVDAEFEEIKEENEVEGDDKPAEPAAIAKSPSIAPTESENNTNDVAAQNRSESAQ